MEGIFALHGALCGSRRLRHSAIPLLCTSEFWWLLLEDSLPNTGRRRNVSTIQNDFQLNYVSRVLVFEILISNFKI